MQAQDKAIADTSPLHGRRGSLSSLTTKEFSSDPPCWMLGTASRTNRAAGTLIAA